MDKLNKEQHYCIDIMEAVFSLFDEESENFKGYKLQNIDATAFFTGFIMAYKSVYERLTRDCDGDMIDTVSMINRLTFQYLNKNGKTREGE